MLLRVRPGDRARQGLRGKRVKVFALLCFYDEEPEHLHRCVSSLAGLADHVVAVDGAYAHYPDAKAASHPSQRFAIVKAAREAGIKRSIHVPPYPWQGGEVEKRAAMFQFARDAGATPADWLLILDGDMHVAKSAGGREALAAVTEDVAEVTIHNVRPDDYVYHTYPRFRSLFRALPGLTVKWTHFLYVAPKEVGWRYLWHTPSGHIAEHEPAANLTEDLTLHHRRLDRTAERDASARTYYQQRDARSLERVPDVW